MVCSGRRNQVLHHQVNKILSCGCLSSEGQNACLLVKEWSNVNNRDEQVPQWYVWAMFDCKWHQSKTKKTTKKQQKNWVVKLVPDCMQTIIHNGAFRWANYGQTKQVFTVETISLIKDQREFSCISKLTGMWFLARQTSASTEWPDVFKSTIALTLWALRIPDSHW